MSKIKAPPGSEFPSDREKAEWLMAISRWARDEITRHMEDHAWIRRSGPFYEGLAKAAMNLANHTESERWKNFEVGGGGGS